jgi:hypothetical protein
MDRMATFGLSGAWLVPIQPSSGRTPGHVDAAPHLEDLQALPSNRLEGLNLDWTVRQWIGYGNIDFSSVHFELL